MLAGDGEMAMRSLADALRRVLWHFLDVFNWPSSASFKFLDTLSIFSLNGWRGRQHRGSDVLWYWALSLIFEVVKTFLSFVIAVIIISIIIIIK